MGVRYQLAAEIAEWTRQPACSVAQGEGAGGWVVRLGVGRASMHNSASTGRPFDFAPGDCHRLALPTTHRYGCQRQRMEVCAPSKSDQVSTVGGQGVITAWDFATLSATMFGVAMGGGTMRAAAIMVALSCALASCVAAPGGPKDDAGLYPDNYEQIIKGDLNQKLKDPYSIRDLSISRPVSAAFWTGVIHGGNVKAWGSCVRYNAKNSYGAYVGMQAFTYFIKSGAVIWTLDGCDI